MENRLMPDKIVKTLLIIYPHWHPTNLAGVHRPRLIGNFLSEFGWKPRVLTVDSIYFEEQPDPDFEKTFSSDFDVKRIKALKSLKLRLIGDIGLRAFFQLFSGAKDIINKEKIDFIWLPIPSFYNALLGRLLYEKTKIPYGIDYIDPWVRDLTNQNGIRSSLSQALARFLEPIAVKKAALISGVSVPYYKPVLERNFPEFFENYNLLLETINNNTKRKIVHVAMPYGFDPEDHNIKLPGLSYPWEDELTKGKIWLYAGAFLPNSHFLLSAFFQAIQKLRKKKLWDESIRLWFIGTGEYPAKRIASYAQDFGLQDVVIEKRKRYPFLQVLNFLSAADTVMVIGSTEEHYTASKTFQALLSQNPVFSVFHYKSNAVEVLEDCKADDFTVRYVPDQNNEDLVLQFEEKILKRIHTSNWNPELDNLNKYSARESSRNLIEGIEKALSEN